MASYRPFPPPPPPQSAFPPPPQNQNSLPPPPPPPLVAPRGNQYSQNWGYGSADGGGGYGVPPRNPIPPHPQLYSYPPPPTVDSSYPPPPPPPPPQNSMTAPPPGQQMYYPSSSQYAQFNPQQPFQQQPPPPPPPSSPPPSSSVPPPPPPPSQPPPPPPPVPVGVQGKESRLAADKGVASASASASGWREPGHSNQGGPSSKKQHANKSAALPPVPGKKSNGASGRVETEDERRLRKKREMEKHRQDEKHRQQLKESQNKVLHKTQMLSSGIKGHGSISGSHMGERRTTPFLSGERAENRLKKPTTFLCKLK